MSFTRFYDDPCRVRKQLQESTGPGRYMLDVPGNGLKPCFMEDPFVRLQKWGANLHSNTINLESALMGIEKKGGRDCINQVKQTPQNSPIQYPSCEPFTEQPRATMPAWTARDLEQNNFLYLPLDPQEHTLASLSRIISIQDSLNVTISRRKHLVSEFNKCHLSTHSHSVELLPHKTVAIVLVRVEQLTCRRLRFAL